MAEVRLLPRATGDPGLSRCINHLRALGFYVEPCTRSKMWLVRLPGGQHGARFDQRALKTLARACRHFPAPSLPEPA